MARKYGSIKPKFVIIFFILTTISFLFFASHINSSNNILNMENFLIFLISILSLSIGLVILDVREKRCTSIFLITFGFFVCLSTYSYSIYQKPPDIDFLSVIFISSTIYPLGLYFSESVYIEQADIRGYFDVEKILYILVFLYIFLSVYIFKSAGIRFFDVKSGLFLDRESYIVPTVSGLKHMLFFALLLNWDKMKLPLKFIFIIAVVLISLLSVSRGDLFRVAMFVFAFKMFGGDKLKFSPYSYKNLFIALLVGIISFITFAYLGEKRQLISNPNFDINILLGSDFSFSTISWALSYTSFGFTVLAEVLKSEPFGYPMYMLPLVSKWLVGNDFFSQYLTSLSSFEINGFNATTFLGPMIYDLGELFFIELILLSFISSVLIIISRFFGFLGGYIYMIVFTALLIFGNYILFPSYIMGFIGGLVIHLISKNRRVIN